MAPPHFEHLVAPSRVGDLRQRDPRPRVAPLRRAIAVIAADGPSMPSTRRGCRGPALLRGPRSQPTGHCACTGKAWHHDPRGAVHHPLLVRPVDQRWCAGLPRYAARLQDRPPLPAVPNNPIKGSRQIDGSEHHLNRFAAQQDRPILGSLIGRRGSEPGAGSFDLRGSCHDE